VGKGRRGNREVSPLFLLVVRGDLSVVRGDLSGADDEA
jgi:hypothetical protein